MGAIYRQHLRLRLKHRNLSNEPRIYMWGDLHGLQPVANGLEEIRLRSHQS
jgi:hypothetical protein